MSKIRLSGTILFIFSALLFSSCASLQKMKKDAYKIKYSVTPEVLEAKGGQVAFNVQGTFPEKYFLKKATVAAKPVLKYQGGEKDFNPVMLQGEKVRNNYQVISYTNGGTFSTKDETPFMEAMRKSELVMMLHATKGNKAVDFDPVKIADGVLATSTLVDINPITILGVQKSKNTTGVYNPEIDKFQRYVPDKYTADIIYLINVAVVRPQQLTKEDMKRLDQYIYDAYKGNHMQLKGVDIAAYASPDGPLDFNTRLSEKRKETSSKAMEDVFKKENVQTNINAKSMGEDWEGFKMLMEKSNIPDKDLMLRVLSMYSDPDVRNREMHKLTKVFTIVAKEILPQLRRAEITANTELIGKSDEQILSLAMSDPSKLNQAELLYAATLTKDLNQQKSIYTSFTKIYSDDWRGYNNLGMVLMEQGDVDGAWIDFEKADQLDHNNPIIQNNLGCAALKKDQLSKAEDYFKNASSLGEKVNENMGIVMIMKGQYDAAVKDFGPNPENPANKALAQLLSGDNNGAMSTLNSAPSETALIDYLKAVVDARTNNAAMFYENLGKAIQKDPSYKSLAKTDLEFAKYFGDPKFISLVQ